VSVATGDCDGDGVPNGLEIQLGLNPLVKDNNLLANTELGRRLFVDQTYRDVLGRDADDAGRSFWVSQLAAAADPLTGRVNMAQGFVFSGEAQNTLGQASRIFYTAFSRTPDVDGLRYWGGQLAAGQTAAQVAEAFASSAEFVARYGQLSDRDYINRLYLNVLGRNADTGGSLSGLLNSLRVRAVRCSPNSLTALSIAG
jgi:hypothetical protein